MVRVVILICLIVFNFFTISYANDDISGVIELYKGGKYQECITKAETLTKTDPTSVLSYYYIALSYAQLGKKDLAIKNYDKVIALGTNKSLTNYAKTGKAKLQPKTTKEKAKQVTGADFMLEDVDEEKKTTETAKKEEAVKNTETSKKAEEPKKSQPVAQKQQQKPVQKTNDGQPTNDEIVNAIRVLQRAGLLQGGLGALAGNQQTQQTQQGQTPQQYAQQAQQYQEQMKQMQQSYMDPRTQELQQMLMMMNSGNNNNGYGGYNNGYDMMQMMPYLQNGGKMSPEMVKMMMMKNMMPDFSSGNNNGY